MDTTLYISHASALRYWRWRRSTHVSLPIITCPQHQVDDACTRISDINRYLDMQWDRNDQFAMFGKTIHVLGASGKTRVQGNRISSHVCGVDLPSGAFVKLAPNIMVASPALAFLQVAHSIPFDRLVALGMELCGTYSLPIDHGASTQYSVIPVTTPEEIVSFVQSINGGRNSSASIAQKAARYINAGSGSPMETVVYILICLPHTDGGYALHAPLQNAMLDRFGNITHDVSEMIYRPDFLWPEDNFILEYFGGKEHAGEKKGQLDLERIDQLSRLGYTVRVLKYADVANPDVFDSIVREIARRTHQRIRLPKGFGARQAALRASILPYSRYC